MGEFVSMKRCLVWAIFLSFIFLSSFFCARAWSNESVLTKGVIGDRIASQETAALEALAEARESYKKSKNLVPLLKAMHRLAFIESALGKNAESNKLCREAIGMVKSVYGESNVWEGEFLKYMGRNFSRFSRFKEALDCYRKELAIYKKVFGEDSPKLVGVMSSIGSLFAMQGRYKEAEPWLRQAMQASGKLKDQGSVAAIGASSDMALLLLTQGRLDESERLFSKVRDAIMDSYGKQDPRYAMCMNSLGEIYLKKGSGENFQVTFAKEGRFKQVGKNQFLELNFGETISVINDKITNFKFKKTDFNLSNFEDNTTTYKKTQEVATLDLIKCYHNLMNLKFLKIDDNFQVENCRSDNIDNIIKELYKRIIIPLYIPVLILISLMLIFKSKENINYSKYRILIFLIGFVTIIISEMTIRLINEDFIKNLKIFVIPIILVIILYLNYLIKFKSMRILK